jgi:hypothetical protein
MNALKMTTAAALVALIGFAQTTDAAPLNPKLNRSAKARKVALRTDLRCSIEGFYDAAATQPLPHGSHVVNLDEMYVRVTVHNAGRLAAKGFTSNAKVTKDGTSVYDNGHTFDLPAGFSMSFPLVKVDTHHNSTVNARLDVDTANGIKELSERNNSCRFEVKSSKLH